jgi:hypothetical protein
VELSAQRDGLRTQVALFVDGDQVGDASGLGRVLTPLPVADPIAAGSTGKPDAGVSDAMVGEPPRPTVLVLSVLPGTVSRALPPRPALGFHRCRRRSRRFRQLAD